MRQTCRHYFGEAVITYDEKPREQWLFDYPAQVSLCGTQIWWTTEVNMSFSRLEEGFENALKEYQKKQVTICYIIYSVSHVTLSYNTQYLLVNGITVFPSNYLYC